MHDWLAPIRRALDLRRDPAAIFFRDDDAGWDDNALFALLDVFAARGIPVDLAAIPAAVTPDLAGALAARRAAGAAIGVHQHGWIHANHEPEGRRCEFGPARSHARQRGDIAEGQARLRALFGNGLDPIFTPPWNRCSQTTADVLNDLGFEALSRDHTAAPLALGRLRSAPVCVDWTKWVSTDPSGAALAHHIAASLAARTPCGIMLHHATKDAEDRHRLDDLLSLLVVHPMARPRQLRDLALAPLAEVSP